MGRDPRRARWIVVPVAAAIALAAVVGVVWLGGSSDDGTLADGQARAAPGPGPSASATAGGDPWARLAEATRAADAAEGRDPCGWEALRADDDVDAAQKLRAEEQLRLAQDALARRLASAPDELGRLLGAHLAGDQARIVDLGGRTRDPLVFGMARLICGAAIPGSDCERTLNAQRWVELDPDNAAAWWAVAADTADREQALSALARARQTDRVVLLRGAAMRRLAQEGGVPSSAVYQIGLRYEGMLAATTPAPMRAMGQVCGRGMYGGDYPVVPPAGTGEGAQMPRRPVLDDESRQACKASALHYLRVGPDLVDKSIAIGLATRWGARSEDMPYSREQLKALTQRMFEALSMDAPELFTPASEAARGAPDPKTACRRLRAEMDLLALTAQVGEVEAVKRLAGAQPR